MSLSNVLYVTLCCYEFVLFRVALLENNSELIEQINFHSRQFWHF